MNRYVTQEQRNRRPIFIATLRACRAVGSAEVGLRVFWPAVPRPRDRSSAKDHSEYFPSKRQSGSDLRASSQNTLQRHYPSY